MDKTEALKPCPFCGAADAGHCELLDTNGGECPWEMMREDELQVSGVDANAVSFPQPRRKDGEEPCGECHLQVGETCDICGAKRAEQALAPLIAKYDNDLILLSLEAAARVAEANDSPTTALYVREAAASLTRQTERIEELERTLDRQCDNMAFILNHHTLPDQWYYKFTKELGEDRRARSALGEPQAPTK